MKQELQRLRSSVKAMTMASVESLVQRLLDYSSRPLSNFNKFDALAMMDTLHNTAHDTHHAKDNYYRLAYQTVRAKTDLPSAQFRSLLLRLIGDKDHEKVFDIVSKVEKSFKRDQSDTGSTSRIPSAGRSLARSPCCYYCHHPGHFQA